MKTKGSLDEEFLALNAEQRRSVHLILCKDALRKWDSYIRTQISIKYVETVAGTRQEVDKQLPFDAFTSARQGLDLLDVGKRYLEPIVALQDDDLTFPENITFTYYAIYNLFRKYAKNEVIDDWLIVNQVLSMEDDNKVRESLLNNAIQRVKL